jgi:hypothetical protein
MKTLITYSLLSAWQWLFNATGDYEQTAMSDFMATLKREKRPYSEAAERGFEFERLVEGIIDGRGQPGHKWYDAAQKIAEVVKGGQSQYKAKKEISYGTGKDLLLYGRMDYLKAGVIYDVKFTGSYSIGKFFNSLQHPVYFELVPEASEFVYLISNGSQVWRESYRREDALDLNTAIFEFFDYLTFAGLLPVYEANWQA